MELFSTAYWILALVALVLIPTCIVVYQHHARDARPVMASLRTRKGRSELVIALAGAFTPLVQVVIVAALGLWLLSVVLHRFAFPEREVL